MPGPLPASHEGRPHAWDLTSAGRQAEGCDQGWGPAPKTASGAPWGSEEGGCVHPTSSGMNRPRGLVSPGARPAGTTDPGQVRGQPGLHRDCTLTRDPAEPGPQTTETMTR